MSFLKFFEVLSFFFRVFFSRFPLSFFLSSFLSPSLSFPILSPPKPTTNQLRRPLEGAALGPGPQDRPPAGSLRGRLAPRRRARRVSRRAGPCAAGQRRVREAAGVERVPQEGGRGELAVVVVAVVVGGGGGGRGGGGVENSWKREREEKERMGVEGERERERKQPFSRRRSVSLHVYFLGTTPSFPPPPPREKASFLVLAMQCV